MVYLSSAVDEEKITPEKKIIMSHGTGYAPQNKELCIDLYKNLSELLHSDDIKVCSLRRF